MTMVVAQMTKSGEVNVYSDNATYAPQFDIYTEVDSKTTIIGDWIVSNYAIDYLSALEMYFSDTVLGRIALNNAKTTNDFVEAIVEFLESHNNWDPIIGNGQMNFVVVDNFANVYDIEVAYISETNDYAINVTHNHLKCGEHLIFAEGEAYSDTLDYYIENGHIDIAFSLGNAMGHCISKTYDNFYF